MKRRSFLIGACSLAAIPLIERVEVIAKPLFFDMGANRIELSDEELLRVVEERVRAGVKLFYKSIYLDYRDPRLFKTAFAYEPAIISWSTNET